MPVVDRSRRAVEAASRGDRVSLERLCSNARSSSSPPPRHSGRHEPGGSASPQSPLPNHHSELHFFQNMGVSRVFFVVLVLLCILVREGSAATFTFLNRCTGTVWPGIQSNAGSSRLDPTGFVLPPGTSRAVPAPSGWSGRVWARTGCAQDATGRIVCATGDCGSGTLECDGQNAATPATLAEFTLAGGNGDDFYDVSLVDGYNLPILIEPAGSATGATTCAAAGCTADLNARCPAELRTEGGAGCRSACDAFGKPDTSCHEGFTAVGLVVNVMASWAGKAILGEVREKRKGTERNGVKSSGGPTPTGPTPTLPGSGATPQMPRPEQGGPDGQGVMLGDTSWLASLATGDVSSAPPTTRPATLALRASLLPLLLLGLML
nr:unnamed protein product [Digitaria exilis]